MKLSEMKSFLKSEGIHLTKSLGQNFLHDSNQLRRIVSAAGLSGSDQVLEIGPGLGPLTGLLLEKARRVLALEKDRRLAEVLQKRFERAHNLSLMREDALEFLRREPPQWAEWKLVSNLPYSVASPILVELAQFEKCPQRMVATLQLEVAQRIAAQAGEESYGLLALLLQLRYEPAGLFKIAASCFFPEPKVDSACITLLRRPEPLLSARQSRVFTSIARKSFSQRRKMMFKLLKEDYSEATLARSFDHVGLSPRIRAEAVSLLQFVSLTKLLSA